MRMFFQRIVVAFSVVILPDALAAYTIVNQKVKDPVGDGECYVHGIGSFGSYIYNYPSKYHFVYEPQMQVWTCPSGYVSLAQDFDDISLAERQRIAEYLAGQPALFPTQAELEVLRKKRRQELVKEYSDEGVQAKYNLTDEGMEELLDYSAEQVKWFNPAETPEEHWERRWKALERLEAIYALRDKDAAFWAFFYRVLAYRYEDRDPERAARYRRQALPLILGVIDSFGKPSDQLVGLHFVAGEYARREGDHTLAREQFRKAWEINWNGHDRNRRLGSSYFDDLILEREALIGAD